MGAAGRGRLVLLLAAAPLVLLGLGTPLALPAAVAAAAAAILLLLLLLLAGRRSKDGLVALQLANQVKQVLGGGGEGGGTGGWGPGDERSGRLRLPRLPVKPPVQAFPAVSHTTPTPGTPLPTRLTLLSCTKLGGSARVTVTRTFCSSLYVSLAILSLSV